MLLSDIPSAVRARRAVVLAAAAVAIMAAPAVAQIPEPEYPNVRIAGRLQFQAYAADNEDYPAEDVGPSSEIFPRRVRLEASGQLTERISFVIQPSFEGGRASGVRLRDAYVDYRLNDPRASRELVVRVGQEKRPFGRYERLSSNNLPTIERGAGDGLLEIAANDLFADAEFLSHDVGAALVWTGGRTTLHAGVYNGAGEQPGDENDSKSYGARATLRLLERLEAGASFYSADAIVGADSAFRHDAWELDVQWGRPGQPGLFLLGDAMAGVAANATRDDLRGYTLVAAYHIRMPGERPRIFAIEPSLMADYGDSNADADDDEAMLYRAVLGVYLSSRAHWRIAYEYQGFAADALDSVQALRTMLAVSW